MALGHYIIIASSYGWSANVDFFSLMHLKQLFDLSHTHTIIILARDSVLPQYVETY